MFGRMLIFCSPSRIQLRGLQVWDCVLPISCLHKEGRLVRDRLSSSSSRLVSVHIAILTPCNQQWIESVTVVCGGHITSAHRDCCVMNIDKVPYVVVAHVLVWAECADKRRSFICWRWECGRLHQDDVFIVSSSDVVFGRVNEEIWSFLVCGVASECLQIHCC